MMKGEEGPDATGGGISIKIVQVRLDYPLNVEADGVETEIQLNSYLT